MVVSMKRLNSFYLKLFALLFMTIDHIGIIFGLSHLFRIIGRLSFPLFAFLLYQGYQHTKNRRSYFLRLFSFGFIIEIVLYGIRQFVFVPLMPINIFILLSLGVLSLAILDTFWNELTKIALITYLVYITIVLNVDYSWYGIIYILSFKFYPKYYYISFLIQVILAYLTLYFYNTDIQYYALFSWIFIYLYNHKRGYPIKYLFYLYYPLHLIVLYLILLFFK